MEEVGHRRWVLGVILSLSAFCPAWCFPANCDRNQASLPGLLCEGLNLRGHKINKLSYFCQLCSHSDGKLSRVYSTQVKHAG